MKKYLKNNKNFTNHGKNFIKIPMEICKKNKKNSYEKLEKIKKIIMKK